MKYNVKLLMRTYYFPYARIKMHRNQTILGPSDNQLQGLENIYRDIYLFFF